MVGEPTQERHALMGQPIDRAPFHGTNHENTGHFPATGLREGEAVAKRQAGTYLGFSDDDGLSCVVVDFVVNGTCEKGGSNQQLWLRPRARCRRQCLYF